MNANFEKYIEGLSPELQERARACKTKEELNDFIADNDLELPEDALELVSGGLGGCDPNAGQETADIVIEGAFCPDCGAELYKNGLGIASMVPPPEPDGTTYGYCKACVMYKKIPPKGASDMLLRSGKIK